MLSDGCSFAVGEAYCPGCRGYVAGDHHRGEVKTVARIESIKVNDTLTVGVRTECKPSVWIDRDHAGLVSIRPDEVQPLIEALSEAAGLLAESEAQRARSSDRVVTARPVWCQDPRRRRRCLSPRNSRRGAAIATAVGKW